MTRNNLKLPCALKNGIVIPIERAKPHEKGYVCPGCYSEVIVKKGEKRIAHFAHKAGVTCTTGYQTAMHLLAKELILREKRFRLPDLSEKYAVDGCFTVFVSNRKVLLSLPLAKTLDLSDASVVTECKLFDMIPDIVIDYKGQRLIVEIFVTHKVSAEKVANYQSQKISIIEIDLSKQKILSEDDLKKLLCDSTEHKIWLYNRKKDLLASKMDLWNRNTGNDKFVIYTYKNVFKNGQEIDGNIIFKPNITTDGNVTKIADCPRKIHYSKNSFFALKEECKKCPFYIGYYESPDFDNLRDVPEKGILCQKQPCYQKPSVEDLKQWLLEYAREEARIVQKRPYKFQPDSNKWTSMIEVKAASFIPELNESIDREELYSTIFYIVNYSFGKYLLHL
ncbi:competence protein [Sphaerochaeta pleomorpha str. Grapes]|uniref:Competence protein n=1 Tax=Sphaerochaeta pleomorpha (strain ATCC BAA-1885 / DSM 22778 / Grapes) TaxID=158190 RepID=G8QQR4_SPHPG|nr:competence protein [Sphaerochaeta pleomorpha]AEV28695.1 competence protein [Sphaerochaeta pleomorpha str. Grapes]